MKQLNFSVLSYFPSLLSEERINIGVAFHDVASNKFDFEYIKKWSRVETFDDEVDIDILRLTVSGIANKLSYTLDNIPTSSLYEFTRHFVNELKFGPIQSLTCDNIEQTIELTKKIHLRFDYDKNERLDENSQKKFLKMLLKFNQYSFDSKSLIGSFNESVTFDFVINEKKCIKIVKLTKLNTHLMIHHMKSWAFTSSALSKNYNITFLIVDADLVDNTATSTIKRILKSSGAEVLNFDDYITSLKTISPLLQHN